MCIVMGRRTYEASGKDFPYNCKLNIVITSDKALLQKRETESLFTNFCSKEIIKLAKDRGFTKLLIIGGGKTNASFLREGLIDDSFLVYTLKSLEMR